MYSPYATAKHPLRFSSLSLPVSSFCGAVSLVLTSAGRTGRFQVRVAHHRAEGLCKIQPASEFEHLHRLPGKPLIDERRAVLPHRAGTVLTAQTIFRLVAHRHSAPEADVPLDKGHPFRALGAEGVSGVADELRLADVAGHSLGIDGVPQPAERGFDDTQQSLARGDRPAFALPGARRHQKTSLAYSSSMRLMSSE